MNDTPMAAGRRADSARRQRVIKALSDTARTGEEISVSGIARQAGVDRAFLYRHRDLLEQVHAAEAQPPADGASSSLVSRASLQADLAGAQARSGRLGARVRQLEKKLSGLLGEQAWQESGLGAPRTPAPSNDGSLTSNRKPPTCLASWPNAPASWRPPGPPTGR